MFGEIKMYIQISNKQRQATRKAKRLNELAAEYNLNVATIYNKQIRRKKKKRKKKKVQEKTIITITALY